MLRCRLEEKFEMKGKKIEKIHLDEKNKFEKNSEKKQQKNFCSKKKREKTTSKNH